MEINRSSAALATLSILAAITTVSCSKDTYHNPNNISVKVGDKDLQSTRVNGTASSTEMAIDGFPAGQGDTSMIHIVMNNDIKVNEPDAFQHSRIIYTAANGKTYSGDNLYNGHGTLTITSWDSTGQRIAGTFSGIFYDVATGSASVAIADGKFNSAYSSF